VFEKSRSVVLGGLAFGIMALAIMNLIHHPAPSIHYLTPDELAQISPHLASGYRDGKGNGPAFFGILKSQWAELSAAEKREDAELVIMALGSSGVREVMVFDDIRRLKIQGANGFVRLPPRE